MTTAPEEARTGLPDVLQYDECQAAGISRRQLQRLLKTRRWQSPFPRVYVTFSGPVPRRTMLEAALAYAGPAAALSHETAAALHGFGPWPAVITVSVPYERCVRRQPGLRIHRSRTLSATVVHPTLVPRRTRAERTVLDCLDRQGSALDALALVANAVQKGRTTAVRLRAALLASPKTRWRRMVLDALPDVGAGAHSVLELHDARIRRRHGLPAGRRQVRRFRDGTEQLDLYLEKYGVHVEFDGRLGHDEARDRWRDMDRDNASELARLRHLRYGWADVFGRPCAVAIQQAVVLRQQGWAGRFRRCRECPRKLPPGL